ncbi:MAG TPA: hypothetical protein DHW22_05510, partial [Planctomycetaceae bacterium]|nr:hypothetical protein [Planctomycetaceae bacterium]
LPTRFGDADLLLEVRFFVETWLLLAFVFLSFFPNRLSGSKSPSCTLGRTVDCEVRDGIDLA